MSTILLVDDDDSNRDMLARRLERKGYVILLAANGLEAIAAAEQHATDLILMDMGMPVMDGWSATRVLKSKASTRHIPVIGLTAYAMAADHARVLACGCDDYDSKPIDLSRLIEKIIPLLKRQCIKTSTISGGETA